MGIKSKIKRAIFAVLKLISYIIPKSKRIWLFGAWGGELYADNTKYLFEYLHTINTRCKLVWISKNNSEIEKIREKGFLAYNRRSIKGLWYIARGKVAFCTEGTKDISYQLNKKTKIIQLWHGMGIKSVGKESGWYKNGLNANALKKNHAKWYWLCASEEAKFKYMNSFDVPKEKFYITGQPKDDAFVNIKQSGYINELRKNYPNARIAVYLPTHRNFGKSDEINDIMSIESFEKLNKRLASENIVMIFKPHFHEFKKYKGYETSFSNIIFAIDKEKFGDVYEFLPCCDIMITDYSGIMFGYLASGKPIVYFTYDYDEYVSNDAGFCYDFNDITYGPVCKTWDEVVECLSTIKSEDYAELREKQRARFCPYSDGENCQRVYETTLKILKIKGA